jgi:hypothetical protein
MELDAQRRVITKQWGILHPKIHHTKKFILKENT